MFLCLNNRDSNGSVIKSKYGQDLFLNDKYRDIGKVFYSGSLDGLPSNTYYNQLWNKNLTIDNEKRFKYCEHCPGYNYSGYGESQMYFLIDQDNNAFTAGRGYRGGIGYTTGWNSNSNFTLLNGKFKKISSIRPVNRNQQYCSSFFLTTQGRLYFSGRYYDNNQVGFSLTDTQIQDKGKIIDVCAMLNGCAILDQDGYIWSKGNNDAGQLGRNSTSRSYNFTKIGFYNIDGYTSPYIVNNWKQISCGYRTFYALNNNGQLYGCGANENGQLGLGNNSNYTTLQRIGGNLLFKKVKAGYYHMICQDIDGNIYTVGKNNNGQLGTGDFISRNQLTKIFSNINHRDIFAGQNQTAIIDNYGGLYACGYSNRNIINGFYGNVSIFTKVGCYNNVKHIQMTDKLFTVIAGV